MNGVELDEQLVRLIGQYQTLEYLRVIIVTLFFYDFFMSLKREILSIWTGKWKTLNVLYLLARYIPFFNFIEMILTFFIDYETRFCMPLFQIYMWSSMIGLTIAEACFCLRAYALWGASRSVAIFLAGLYTTMTVTGFVLNGFVAASATIMESPINFPRLIPRCVIHFHGASLAICGWIIVMIVDTTLISMIIYAKSQVYRSFRNTQSDLLTFIYRDAIYYFFCNFLIATTSVIFYFTFPGPIKSASSLFGTTLFSILSCKVMLRLRAFGNSHLLDQDITSLGSSIVLSSLRFDRRTDGPPVSHVEECLD